MAMVRLTFFVRDDVLDRSDALVYRSGVNRSHLSREAVDIGLPGVRAALPGLRARYGEGRTVRRRRAMDPVDAAERADAAHLRLERRLVRVARMLLRHLPDIGREDLRAALDESCAPNEFGQARDELLDRAVARVPGDTALAGVRRRVRGAAPRWRERGPRGVTWRSTAMEPRQATGRRVRGPTYGGFGFPATNSAGTRHADRSPVH